MDFGTNKILITGANGWLGKSLIFDLLNGLRGISELKTPNNNLDIKCLVLPNEKNTKDITYNNKVSVFEGDLTSFEDCDSFLKGSRGAILFHCAGIIHPQRTKEFFDINLDGTKNILDAAVKNKIKKIIVVSSNSPCGTNFDGTRLFDETSVYNPYMEYGRSKMLMEKLVKSYYDAGKIDTVIIRPPWFYGPFQPPRQIKFYRMIRDGKVPVVGNGENLRSMAFTSNITQGLIRAAIENRASGNTYWIADKRPYSFNEIIAIIRSVMYEEFNIRCIEKEISLPNVFSDVAYLLDRSLQYFGFYNKEIHVLSEMNKNIACDIKKAEDELGYMPKISLYQGTKIAYEKYLKSNGS